MQHVTRLILTVLCAVSLSGAAWAKAPAKETAKEIEYKRADANFYWKGDVLKVDPTAAIFAPGSYTQKGESYFITPKKKAPKEIYVQVINDWIEPITPPDMPASLGVADDAMQIREPQGDVQVALPSSPATFIPATPGMSIPNGTVVKTGANGTAAVLMGGVNSIRLVPNSQAAVQQTVTPELRSTEVDLTAGAVFSKVGQRIGEKQDYQVHTPFGVAAARGTDFVSIAMPARTDVWIAQGTVQLDAPDGKMVGMVKSEGTGALKIVRFPVMTDPHQAMMASAETMTSAMNFIPMANVKIKALYDKQGQGVKLTPKEVDYLGKIKKVPCLIKLVLVEPAATAPAPIPPPAPAPAPAAAAPVALAPIDLDVCADGKVDFQGATLTLEELKPKLADLAKTTPDQPLVIKRKEKLTKGQLKKVLQLCHDSKLTKITIDKTAPPAVAPAETPAAPTPPAPEAPAAPAAVALAPAAPLAPMDLELRADGKVDFQGATLSLDELKPKLADLAKATPDQPIIVKGREKVDKVQLKKVLAECKAAKLKKVTIAKAEPKVAAPAAAVPAIPTAETPSAPATPAPETPAAPKQLPPAMELPINLELRPDGKIDFQSATLSLLELKSKLKEIGSATPDQPLVVKTSSKVRKTQLRKVLAACQAAKLKNVTVVKSGPDTETIASDEASGPVSSSAKPVSTPITSTTATTTMSSSSSSEPVSTGPNDTVP